MANQHKINYFKNELLWKNNLLKKLIEYYESSQNALFEEKKGHTPDWQAVEDIADKIEDDHDLESIKENL